MKLHGVLIAILTAAPIFAHAASDNGFYLDASVGRGSNYDTYDASDLPRSTVADVNIGYHWSWFGIEAGYVDFSKESAIVASEPIPLKATQSQHGETLGVSGHWNFDSNWYLSARTGAYFRHESESISAANPQTHYPSKTDNGTSWYVGAGAGYDFTPHFGLGVRYDLYRGHEHTANVPSLNAEIRF